MSKRILVVEDQADTRQIIRDMLAPTDYEIIEAENGEQALATIARQRPDLILMDIQLPIMDGYTATRQIKSDPALRSIPIIAVTSYALREKENKARAAGCDDYVPKPFSPRPLPGENSQFPAITAASIAAVHEFALAQSGDHDHAKRCPLLGAKRTSADSDIVASIDTPPAPTINSARNHGAAGRLLWPKRVWNGGWQQSSQLTS